MGRTRLEEQQNQQDKANDLVIALRNKGYHPGSPATSVTNFGISTYVTLYDDLGVHRTFRISDHSVTNTHRVLNEIHYTESSCIDSIISNLEDRIKENKSIIDHRNALHDQAEQKQIILDAKWFEMKPLFEGLTFKKNDRTYQNIEEFSSQKQRSNIYQKPNGSAFSYEWTEPLAYNGYDILKPSNNFIEQYQLPVKGNNMTQSELKEKIAKLRAQLSKPMVTGSPAVKKNIEYQIEKFEKQLDELKDPFDKDGVTKDGFVAEAKKKLKLNIQEAKDWVSDNLTALNEEWVSNGYSNAKAITAVYKKNKKNFGVEKSKNQQFINASNKDRIRILLYKKPSDADLKKGQTVSYPDKDGQYSLVADIEKVYKQDGIKLYQVDGGSYTADELRETFYQPLSFDEKNKGVSKKEKPDANHMNTYHKWEDDLTSLVVKNKKVSRSDAQGMVEANDFKVQQAYTMGLDNKKAFDHIFTTEPKSDKTASVTTKDPGCEELLEGFRNRQKASKKYAAKPKPTPGQALKKKADSISTQIDSKDGKLSSADHKRVITSFEEIVASVKNNKELIKDLIKTLQELL